MRHVTLSYLLLASIAYDRRLGCHGSLKGGPPCAIEGGAGQKKPRPTSTSIIDGYDSDGYLIEACKGRYIHPTNDTAKCEWTLVHKRVRSRKARMACNLPHQDSTALTSISKFDIVSGRAQQGPIRGPNRFNRAGWRVLCRVCYECGMCRTPSEASSEASDYLYVGRRNTPLPCVLFDRTFYTLHRSEGGGAVDCRTLQCTDFWKIPAGRIFKFALALRCTVFSYVVRTYRDPLLRYEFEE